MFLIHFYCVLHAKKGGGVKIACKIAYVINGRPQTKTYEFHYRFRMTRGVFTNDRLILNRMMVNHKPKVYI